MTGPPTLQLYETDASPNEAVSAPFVEILRLVVSKDKDLEPAQQAFKAVFQSLKDHEHGHDVALVTGESLNLDDHVIVGILGRSSFEVSCLLSRISRRSGLTRTPSQTQEFEHGHSRKEQLYTSLYSDESPSINNPPVKGALSTLESFGELSHIVVDVDEVELAEKI